MATILTIAGSAVSRAGNRIILNQLGLSLDDPERLTWTEIGVAAGTGSWSAGDLVDATIDGTARFIGQTVSAHPSSIGRGCIDVTYTALGLRYLINNIFFTGSDLSGHQAWNLPSADPYFELSAIGKSVGDILKAAIDLHQTKLTALGMADPAYDPAELDAMDVVPRDAVVFSGRLMDNLADLVSQWCPKYTCYADASDGLIHFRNSLTLPEVTLTLDSDPVTLDGMSKTHGECFTRVVVRGAADVHPAYLSLREGTLAKMWTPTDQADWSISDYWNPKGASSSGAVTAMSSTTLTVTADDAAEAWGTTTYWGDKGAIVWAFDPAATGVTFQEYRRITANTVKAAGASGTITVDPPWNNSGYTRYQVRGTSSGVSRVWRAYKIVPVDGDGKNWVADHLVPTFPHSVPWSPADGVLVQVMGPTANVCYSNSGDPPFLEWPWSFQLILPDGATPGYILFNEPVVKAYETQAHLIAGGAAVTAPGDIKVLVPYSIGALTSVKPDDVGGAAQYEGTAKTVDGIERTLYREYPDWIDGRDHTNMLKLAQELLDSVKDTVHEGSITYEGKLTSLLTMGKALDIARAGGTTGWEALKAPVRSVTLEYQDRSSIYVTRAEFSTRRRPFTGDRLYAPVGWGSEPQFASTGTTHGPSFAEMLSMGGPHVAGMADPSAYLADPTSGVANPTSSMADPLGAAGVRTPEGGGDVDPAGLDPRSGRNRQVSQSDQVARDAAAGEQALGRATRQRRDGLARAMRRRQLGEGQGRLHPDADMTLDEHLKGID